MFFLVAIAVMSFATIQPNEPPVVFPKDIASIPFDPPIPVQDTMAALQFGLLAFTAPANTFGSCAKCHNEKKGGFSDVPFPIGKRGTHDTYKKRFGQEVTIDVQPVGTPPLYGLAYQELALTDFALGSNGCNAMVEAEKLIAFNKENAKQRKGVYIQVDVAFGAHSQAQLVEALRKEPFYNDLAYKAFGSRYVTEDEVVTAIGMFEQIFLPYESNYQKYLRGDIGLQDMRYAEGMRLFETRCTSCHPSGLSGKERYKKIAPSSFEGFIRVTGDEADRDMIAAPQLYNLQERSGLFHTEEQASIRKGIKMHAPIYPELFEGLTSRDYWDLAGFVKWDLYDEDCSERSINLVLNSWNEE